MNNKKTILIVDDEKSICETIEAYLLKESFNVLTAHDGKAALEIFENNIVDLIILDLMLPIIPGEEVCKEIRKSSSVPIIMLSAKINEDHKLEGFAIGTDDYVTKPFSPKELIARVYSLLKRINSEENKILSFNDDLIIDLDGILVFKNNEPVNLTPNEYKILSILASNPKRTYTREDLVILLNEDSEMFERTIDTYIKNIRQKIEDENYNYIVTVRGFGYRFNK